MLQNVLVIQALLAFIFACVGKHGATGMGPGAHAAIKTLTKEGFRIISIIDTTRVARGGPKKKGGKRGRRV